MKFISLILAILVLALSMLPCNDNDMKINTEIASVGFSEKQAAHHHNSTAGDNCSPFCICSCCSWGFTVTFINYPIVPCVDSEQKKESVHLYSNVTEIVLPIWQPPQLL